MCHSTLANKGLNANGRQFSTTFVEVDLHDKKNPVYGKVIEGGGKEMDALARMESAKVGRFQEGSGKN
jgi:cyclophilin family peptidyl-prolyl cis-trans isomerase